MYIPDDVLSVLAFYLLPQDIKSLVTTNSNLNKIAINDHYWQHIVTHSFPKFTAIDYCKTYFDSYVFMKRIQNNSCPFCGKGFYERHCIIVCSCVHVYILYHRECIPDKYRLISIDLREGRGTGSCSCPICNKRSPVLYCNIWS